MRIIALVVENDSDARVAIALADRVLTECGLNLDSCRKWGEVFIWSKNKERRAVLGYKVHGHFNGEPGAPDAQNARGVLMILRRSAPLADAVLLIRDNDLGKDDRLKGLNMARDEHESFGADPKIVIIGLAIPKREAWLLSGYVPSTEQEKVGLNKEIKRLNFDPTKHPHRLDASKHGAEHDIKACFYNLNIDLSREGECLKSTTLDYLEERGKETGLPEFFSEIRNRLYPYLR